MVHSMRRVIVLALCLGAFSAAGMGADSIKGKALAGSEKVALMHGWGLITETANRVYIGCMSAPIAADLAKNVLTEQSFSNGLDDSVGPYMEVMLGFTEGAKTASLKTLDYYYVALNNFKIGPMTFNLTPRSSGAVVTSLKGDLIKGGIISGKLKGTSEGPNNTNVSWELEFSTRLRSK